MHTPHKRVPATRMKLALAAPQEQPHLVKRIQRVVGANMQHAQEAIKVNLIGV